MTVEQLAAAVLDACEGAGVEHMLTGAFATSLYGVPRSTSDVDVVVDAAAGEPIQRVMATLAPLVAFDPQVQFDTLTWGRRHVGTTRTDPPLLVELFTLFDDAFVQHQFNRRRRLVLPSLGRAAWLPLPEDLVVQKLRWGRAKDLDDARDVLAVQGLERVDLGAIRSWCVVHGTTERLDAVLAALPVE
jgi:hypothetical protein